MNLWIALLFLLGINNGCSNCGGCGDNNGCGNDCMRPWMVAGGDSLGCSRSVNNAGNDGGCGCAACSGDDGESDGASCGCTGQNGSREFPSF